MKGWRDESAIKYLLLLEDLSVWFPAYLFGYSQLSETLPLAAPTSSSGFSRWSYPCAHTTYIQLHLINIKNKKTGCIQLIEVPNMGQFLSYTICEPLLYERVTFCIILYNSV